MFGRVSTEPKVPQLSGNKPKQDGANRSQEGRLHAVSHHDVGEPRMPPGAPAWVTTELIAETIEAWQGDCDHELTAEDALEILMLFDGLISVLERSDGE
jgi:hypothetical protein